MSQESRPTADERIFVSGSGTYRRTGSCSRCGQCCEDSEANGPVPGMCPLYRLKLADGQPGCAGHGTDPFYLAGCVDWPSKPEHIADKPLCTFRFERVS